jgi:hypothetical protein
MRRVHKLNLHLHSERNNKPISERKKKKKTRGSMSNKTFLVCHCCKKRGHTIDNCWYAKTCSHCGKKGHLEASCWEKQATCHRTDCFQRRNGKKASPIQKQTQRHMERRSMSRSPCSNNKNFFHHCNLSGHWEAKCW